MDKTLDALIRAAFTAGYYTPDGADPEKQLQIFKDDWTGRAEDEQATEAV